MSQRRMPAEWEPQSAIWASWPHNVETWPLNLHAAQDEFVQLIATIAASQKVYLMVPPKAAEQVGTRFEADLNVELVLIDTNDAWARDYAPTFVVDDAANALVAVDWYYNAWGGKYPPFEDDQQVAKKVSDVLGLQHVAGGLCCEGGALEVNQDGVLLTTESCLLNANRNAGFSREEVERLLQERLGCKQVVWLPGDSVIGKALVGDDTDGHIDQLARFVDNETIVHAWCDGSDARFPALAANVEALKFQLPGTKLVPLMVPEQFEFCEREIPASYCNFLFTNEQLIVPQFGVPQDEDAVDMLASVCTDRSIVALPSRNLVVGLGSFHCLTQHQPKC